MATGTQPTGGRNDLPVWQGAAGGALALVALPFHHAPLAVPAEAPAGLIEGVTLALSHRLSLSSPQSLVDRLQTALSQES